MPVAVVVFPFRFDFCSTHLSMSNYEVIIFGFMRGERRNEQQIRRSKSGRMGEGKTVNDLKVRKVNPKPTSVPLSS